MHVRVLPFGFLKDTLGSSVSRMELPEGSTVADLLARISATQPAPLFRGIAVSVNAQYAMSAQVLQDDDQVALLPPVSGGTDEADLSFLSAPGITSAVALYHCPIDSARIIDEVKQAEDGAIVVFDGIVRDNTRGRKTLYLDYEAYEELAEKQMRELAAQARERFGVRHVTIVHRLGRLEIGETSVLIVVASAHRAQAYEASRWLIDTLKKTVPIWKRETFVDGAVWAPGEPFPEELAVSPTEAAHG